MIVTKESIFGGTMKDVEIVKDVNGNDIVRINNIIFRGKQNIDWKAVEVYLNKYIGMIVKVADDEIHIEKDFPNEFAHSVYTKKLRGAYSKAKANSTQGIIEMLKIAKFKRSMANKKIKHNIDANNGWNYYITRFALPVYNEKEKTITYNTYKATLVVRISKGKKLKLYDITEIKKETSTPP